jgi:hypothetical protein
LEPELNQITQVISIMAMTEAARKRGYDPVVCASPEVVRMLERMCAVLGVTPPHITTG